MSFIGDELVIANVQRNQDGNYYNCFAENLVRKSYKDVRLTVQCRCSHYMQQSLHGIQKDPSLQPLYCPFAGHIDVVW